MLIRRMTAGESAGCEQVMPIGILPVAVPFTCVEIIGAVFIYRKLARPAGD